MMFDLAEEAMKFALSCSFILIAYFVIHRWLRLRHLPPGPIGIPLLGYFPFLGKRPYETLRDLSKKYGDIMSFYIGSELVVCVSDCDAAKEILNNPLTLSRTGKKTSLTNFGFPRLTGKEWQQHRTFVVQTMKNLELGGKLLESGIHEDLEDLINEIRNFKGRAMWIEKQLEYQRVKYQMYIFSGRRFTKEEIIALMKKIQKGARELFRFLSPVGILDNFPWIRSVLQFFQVSSYREFFNLLGQYQNIIRNEIKVVGESEETFSRVDFITVYFKKMKDMIHSSPNSFTMENLIADLTSLLITTSDVAAVPVSWLLLLMAEHQGIQEKIHEEIDSTIGRDGVVHYDDRAKLPYTMATVMEMFRWVTIAAFIKRRTLGEFKFKNYTIPKDCVILLNTWAILHDPRYFCKPMEFRPERFLNETGTKVVQVKGYVPFSFGKRKCPGELTTMIIDYIYFVAIMQKFKVTFPPGKVGDLEREPGISPFPKIQGLCFFER